MGMEHTFYIIGADEEDEGAFLTLQGHESFGGMMGETLEMVGEHPIESYDDWILTDAHLWHLRGKLEGIMATVDAPPMSRKAIKAVLADEEPEDPWQVAAAYLHVVDAAFAWRAEGHTVAFTSG